MTQEQIKTFLDEVEQYAIKKPEPSNVHSAEEDYSKTIAYHALATTIYAEAEKMNALKESGTFKESRKNFDSNADWMAHKKSILAETKFYMTLADGLIGNLKLRCDFLRSYISYEKQQMPQRM